MKDDPRTRSTSPARQDHRQSLCGGHDDYRRRPSPRDGGGLLRHRAVGRLGGVVGNGRSHSAVPDGCHDVRGRCLDRHRAGARPRRRLGGAFALAAAPVAAGRRRPVRLPRALFRRPAARPAGRGQSRELSVAAADRAAVGAACRRTPGLAAFVGRVAGFRRRRAAGVRPGTQLHRRLCAGLCAGAGLRLNLVALLRAVAPLRRDADRRHRGLLRGIGGAVARLPPGVRAHGVAGLDDGMARRAGARPRARGRRVLSVGPCRQTRRHPRAGRPLLRHADPLDRAA